MSAFQVDPNHLGAIVRWYLTDCPDYLRPAWREMRPNANDAGDMLVVLAVENSRSVRYRYPSGPLPGPVDAADGPVVCDDRLSRYKKLSPVQVIKACDCLAYQSCEHPEWDASEAKQLLDAVRSAAIALLPGYREAEWAIADGAPSTEGGAR